MAVKKRASTFTATIIYGGNVGMLKAVRRKRQICPLHWKHFAPGLRNNWNLGFKGRRNPNLRENVRKQFMSQQGQIY